MAVEYLGSGNDDGVVLGRTATDKIAFFNATPVVQPAVLTAPASTGSTNSTPYGFSQAQADAIVTWIRAADVAIKALGLTAAS